eukprot:8091714-Lingulodinium_polyedra.AAC.1
MHEEERAATGSASLGVEIDGDVGVVTPKGDRLHRVIGALRYVAQRPQLTGRQLERLVSHA